MKDLETYLLNIIDSKTEATSLQLNDFMTVHYNKSIGYRGIEERRFWIEFDQEMCNEYVKMKEERDEMNKKLERYERR